MALIELQDIQKVFYGEGTETVAVRDISLVVEKGEFVSIMGPSGSGKSTLLHILGFLDRPTRGTYLFDSQDTTTFSEDQLAVIRNERIGFVFQAFHLLSRTTVLENVMLPLVYSRRPKKEHRALAEKALAQVELSHRLQHHPSQLSGGEKQRVAIARALVNEPTLVFADEPTGNLDSKTGKAVMTAIDSLHKQGQTIILITHETATAQYADRIVQLKDGLIVSDAPGPSTPHSYEK
ncbi:MAG: ABC transporter ATP-binding protein [Candidatus Andersenbacteria bacterium]